MESSLFTFERISTVLGASATFTPRNTRSFHVPCSDTIDQRHRHQTLLTNVIVIVIANDVFNYYVISTNKHQEE